EYIDEKNISHHSLLGNLSRERVMAEYAPQAGEETILTLLNDNQLAQVSRRKIERDLQSVVEVLDNQGYDVILLMSTAAIRGMTVRNTIFLEPLRILPPLVSSIVEGHQVGVIVPVEELLEAQAQKWQILQKPPLFSLGDPVHDSEQKIIEAGKELLANGADVIMLDCLGFNQRHRDLLQKQLDVPVLLSNVLIARLAAELLM
ncbi:TPA: AroM family protein, partial [Escherichia albertii]